MDDRKVYWRYHIRYMFRSLDYDHMISQATPKYDLSNYHDVRKNWEDILSVLATGFMPQVNGSLGGAPWPAEWVNLFARWCGEETDPAEERFLYDERGSGHPFLKDENGNP